MFGMKINPENVKIIPSSRRGCIPACSLGTAPLTVNSVRPQNRGMIKERTYEKYIQNIGEDILSFIIFLEFEMPSLLFHGTNIMKL
jgi:hypothetical protein